MEVIIYDIDFSRSIPSHLPPTPSSLEHQALTRPPPPIPSSSSHPSRSPTAAGNCVRSGKWGFYSCDNYFIGFSAGFRRWCTREQLLLNLRSRTGRSLHMMLIFFKKYPLTSSTHTIKPRAPSSDSSSSPNPLLLLPSQHVVDCSWKLHALWQMGVLFVRQLLYWSPRNLVYIAPRVAANLFDAISFGPRNCK